MSIHTAYKFRHFKVDPDTGLSVLDWASHLDGSLRGESIVKGSKQELEVIEAQDWALNALANEGEADILNVYFDAQAVRTTLYFRLAAAAPAETTTNATVTEVSGTGYDGIAVTRGTDWSAPAHDTGTSTGTKTFTGGAGGWTGATDLFLATSQNGATGLFIAYAALSQTRTLAENDTLDVTMTVTLE